MNLQVLLEKYVNSPRIGTIAERISLSHPVSTRISKLQGSASQFVLAAVYQHPDAAKLNHLVILDDAEEAAYFHNTLENLTNAIDLFYFPSSFKNKKNFKLLNASHVMLRTESLMRFSTEGNKRIIVTYPEALFEKVVLPKTLSQNIIRIKTNDTLDVDGMLEKFVGYGFERTDFVYEPGQFAMRGGILDIYSFGNEKPYRVELFGNEVDSIRIFDPETQLSERKLLQINIIPNVETQFDDSEKTTLLEFLPDNTVVWIKDRDILKEMLLNQEEDLELFLHRQTEDSETQRLEEDAKEKYKFHEDDFTDAESLNLLLEQRTIVEFGPETGKARDIYAPEDTIVFSTRPSLPSTGSLIC